MKSTKILKDLLTNGGDFSEPIFFYFSINFVLVCFSFKRIFLVSPSLGFSYKTDILRRHELFPNEIILNIKIPNVKIPTYLVGFT
jgi:hypothetical protein